MKSYVDLNVNIIASDDFRIHNGVILQGQIAEKFFILKSFLFHALNIPILKIYPTWIKLLLMP